MTKLFLAAVAAAAASSSALAQPPAPPAAGAPPMREMRAVSRADVQAQVAAMFARFDSNHDGLVTREEVEAARAAREAAAGDGAGLRRGPGGGATMFARFGGRGFDETDANHDGRISLDEANAFATAIFDRVDTNHDGVVSPEERAAAREAFRAARQGGGSDQR